ncbi:MAG: helix-turn-helix domain-containing protein [Thiomicrospira sp.]
MTSLEQLETLWIEHTLARCHGNKSQAARDLGIDASTLHRKLNKTKP